MTLWLALFLGVLQGLTEFLPISSTAHLRIAPALLNLPDPGAAFTAVVQLGTLLAVIIYFRKELWAMTRDLFVDRSSPNVKLFWFVVVGTIPIAILGVLLKPFIVGEARSLYVVGSALAGFAMVLWWVDRDPKQELSVAELTWAAALIIGCAQALALIPGVSRSGATIVAALVVGLRRDEAARFSFLLSIPAILGAGVFELPDAVRSLGSDALLPLGAATAASAVVGYASIAWFLKFLRTRSLAGFVIYRILLGLAIVALAAAGVIDAAS